MQRDVFEKRILLGITGESFIHLQKKIEEINKLNIEKVSLFLEALSLSEREKVYALISDSCIKKIPLVHIKNDMKIEELDFLSKNFGSSYFTIHEDSFGYLKKWKGYFKKLYLELNYDNLINKKVDLDKIGGFCVDLSHFKAAEESWSKEFEFIINRRNSKRFACNHLNGYSYKEKGDLHKVNSLKDFDYLKTIPKFLFGDVIALELNHSIEKQMNFKKYILDLFN